MLFSLGFRMFSGPQLEGGLQAELVILDEAGCIDGSDPLATYHHQLGTAGWDERKTFEAASRFPKS